MQPRQTLELAEGSQQIGRARDDQVVLDDPERKISRHHLHLDWDGQRATVVDLDSDNGTWLGETRLPPRTPTPWPAEQLLRVGRYWLRLEVPALEADPTSRGALVRLTGDSSCTTAGAAQSRPVVDGRSAG